MCEHEILDCALCSVAQLDHFRDATKMVFSVVTRCFAGLDRAPDRGEEVLPAGVAERFLQIPGEPELHLSRLGVSLGQRVELTLHLDDEFLVHDSMPCDCRFAAQSSTFRLFQPLRQSVLRSFRLSCQAPHQGGRGFLPSPPVGVRSCIRPGQNGYDS